MFINKTSNQTVICLYSVSFHKSSSHSHSIGTIMEEKLIHYYISNTVTVWIDYVLQLKLCVEFIIVLLGIYYYYMNHENQGAMRFCRVVYLFLFIYYRTSSLSFYYHLYLFYGHTITLYCLWKISLFLIFGSFLQ